MPDSLRLFLGNYVAAEESQLTAARKFVRLESPEQVRELMAAIRKVFGADIAEGVLKEDITRLGNVRLPTGTTAREYLLVLFSSLSREARLSKTVKAYDAFISYSSKDQGLAAWLASELRSRGYSVWLDRDEILVGHNIVDKVYQGITESEFLIVLLTKDSVKSKWVKEELTAARLDEIQNAHVTILPIKCDADVEIPLVLRGKRYADMSQSKEEGLVQLTRAIDLHRAQAREAASIPGGPESHEVLRHWYPQVEVDLVQCGFDKTKGGYKDVVIGSPDGEEIPYDKRQLVELLQRTRVRIKGWGGAPFPYDVHPKSQLHNLPDGVRLVDTHTWVFSEWNFHYWQFTETLRFFQRAGLYEDGDLDESGQVGMRDCLSVIWVMKDVCTALMFSSNLLREVNSLRRLTVIHRLGGMRGRRLMVRSVNRAPLLGNYIANEDTIEQESLVGRETDLESEAIRVIGEIFWMFNWQNFPEDPIRTDVRYFLAGEFPRGW